MPAAISRAYDPVDLHRALLASGRHARQFDPDEAKSLKKEFAIPSNASVNAYLAPEEAADQPCVYLCGNSLGPLSKRSATLVREEMETWATRAVQGHFDHPEGRPWADYPSFIHPKLARIVGTEEVEVAVMGTLTANLHLMMDAFYKPTAKRYRILCEARAFPSDLYAFASQAALHGHDPATAVLQLAPRPGEYYLRHEDILRVIHEEGDTIALVLFPGVQFYTGQLFHMKSITRLAQAKGCIVGWDLAHAVGNVPLALHDWGVDFAVWCSYKYLNSGPGSIGGLFIHRKWEASITPRQAGWWGHDPITRFTMPPLFQAIPGAQGFQQSNPSILASASLLGSLEVFEQAGGMQKLRERSILLTAQLEAALRKSKFFIAPERWTLGAEHMSFTIITPSDPAQRGAQLSLMFNPPGIMDIVHRELKRHGVVGDERRPDVIRLAPAPLFNTLRDCRAAAGILELVMLDVQSLVVSEGHALVGLETVRQEVEKLIVSEGHVHAGIL